MEIAGISVDSPYSHHAWSEQLGIPYPLISDFGRTFLKAYRVPERQLRLLPGTASRSSFVVDTDRIIRHGWYQSDSQAMVPMEQILHTVRTLHDPLAR